MRRKGEEESSGADWEETSFFNLESCTFANSSVFFFFSKGSRDFCLGRADLLWQRVKGGAARLGGEVGSKGGEPRWGGKVGRKGRQQINKGHLPAMFILLLTATVNALLLKAKKQLSSEARSRSRQVGCN